MEPDTFDPHAWQDLRDAIWEDDTAAMERVLSTHPELLHVTSPDSCLHLAAGQGRLAIVQRLVALGADVNLDLVGYCGSPLDCAADDGHLEVVRYLVGQGASLSVPRPDRNPLFGAIINGHSDVIRFLLEAGVDPHVVYRGESGYLKNALSFAQEYDRTEIVKLLVDAGCRLPVEGVDEPVWEPEESEELPAADSAREELIAHLAEQFGPVDPLALQEIVPVHDEVHVAINVIPPNELCPFLTLFTTGMSALPMTVPEGEEYKYAELVMHLPPDWPHPRDEAAGSTTFWPVEWLRKLAYYPHWNDTWLGGRFAIIASDEPPIPLGPNTKQTCLLLHADFADWSPLILENGNVVHFYTVTSLYTEERDFEKRHGMVPLLQRLQAGGSTTVVNVTRANVALVADEG